MRIALRTNEQFSMQCDVIIKAESVPDHNVPIDKPFKHTKL